MADSGLIAAVDLGSWEDSFRPVAVDGYRYEGRTYGVPFATENLALFRDTDLAAKSPDSIEDTARVGLALTEKHKKVLPIALPVGAHGDAHHWYALYSARGGALFGQDTQGGYSADERKVGQPGSIGASRSPDSTTCSTPAARPWSPPEDCSGPLSAATPSRRSSLNPTAMTTEVMTALASPGGLGPAWSAPYELAAAGPVTVGFGNDADSSATVPNLAQMADVGPTLSKSQLDVMAGQAPAPTMKGAGSEIQSAIDAG